MNLSPEKNKDSTAQIAKFSDLGLSNDLLLSVAEAGYETPTPIQARAVPLILAGRDLLGIARTGSGKTAGFTLPMLERLAGGRTRARMPRALILEPTRELAAQVEENLESYGKRHRITRALIIGGESMKEQQLRLQRGVDVLVATPGRLLDLFERGQVLLAAVSFLVIDEADRMLDMGFIPDIEKLTRLLPRARQTLLFSATLPPEIRALARTFLRNPEEIYADAPLQATSSVTQEFHIVTARAKNQALRAFIKKTEKNLSSALVFCNRKTEVDALARSLKLDGYNVAALHGDLPQPERTAVLARFREREVRILVCSDVAARGLDIPDVSHVINYDLPLSADDYVHRIGRTGRAGRSGQALSFVVEGDDQKRLADIARVVPEGALPAGISLAAMSETITADAPASRGRRAAHRGGRSPNRGRDRRNGRGDAGRPSEGRRRTRPPAHRTKGASIGPIAKGKTDARKGRSQKRSGETLRHGQIKNTPTGASRSVTGGVQPRSGKSAAPKVGHNPAPRTGLSSAPKARALSLPDFLSKPARPKRSR